MRRVASLLASAHDGVTTAGFRLGMVCLVTIVFAYVYEVVARYVFAAPTWWSNEIVSYAQCIGCFLVLPQVTRTHGHVAVTLLLDTLTPRRTRYAVRMIELIGLVVCLAAAWICASETLRQIVKDVYLLKVQPIPKAWISLWIAYGFASSAIYFARHLFAPADDGGSAGRIGEI